MKTCFFTLAVVTVLQSFSGCGGDSGSRSEQDPNTVPQPPKDTIAPSITHVEPAVGAVDVPLNRSLVVHFSEPLAKHELSNATFRVYVGDPQAEVAGTVRVDPTSAEWTADASLAPNSKYRAVLKAKCSDKAGNEEILQHSWTFTTGASKDLIAPMVSSTEPANSASDVPIDRAISIRFSEPMKASTVTAATVKLYQGSVELPAAMMLSGDTVTLTHAPFAYETTYQVKVLTAVQDLAGNALASIYAFSFTTGKAADTVAPTVTSTAPGNDERNVAVDSAISIRFSESMKASTLTTATIKLYKGTTPIASMVTAATDMATLTPNVDLLYDTVYEVRVLTDTQDLAGNALQAAHVFSFTTGRMPDTQAPTVSSTSPASGARNVAVDGAVSIKFSEAMKAATVSTSTVKLYKSGAEIASSVALSGDTATLTPAANLAFNAGYQVKVLTGVQDLAGNALAAEYTLTFTTGAAPDTTPPTIILTAPVDGERDVAVDQAVSIKFSEALKTSTVSTATIKLYKGNTEVTSAVNLSGDTATVRSNTALAFNTTYEVRVSTGVQDLAGNALASTYSFSFATRWAPDTTAPTVVSTVPANSDRDVKVDTNIRVRFSEAMDASTITTATVRLFHDAIEIESTVSLSADTAILTPKAQLNHDQRYEIRILTSVQDLAGNSLKSAFQAFFRTQRLIDVEPPQVITTDPAQGEADVCPVVPFAFKFSEDVIVSTINNDNVFFRSPSDGLNLLGTLGGDGIDFSFTPSSPLRFGQAYTGTISRVVTDLAGNAMSDSYSWNFSTRAMWSFSDHFEPSLATDRDAYAPQMAIDDADRTMVVWNSAHAVATDELWYSRRGPGIVEERARIGSVHERWSDLFSFAMDTASGHAYAAWFDPDNRLVISSYAAPNWSEPKVLQNFAPGEYPLGLSLIADPEGSAIAAWTQYTTGPSIVHAQRLHADGRLSEVATLDSVKGNSKVEMISDSKQVVTAIWIRPGAIMSSRYTRSTNTWTPPQGVSIAEESRMTDVSLGVDLQDRIYVAWRQTPAVGGAGAIWATASTAGGWEAAKALDNRAGVQGVRARVAGNTVVWWGAGGAYQGRVWASSHQGSGWSAPQVLSGDDCPGSAMRHMNPTIAVNRAQTRAVAFWTVRTREHTALWSATYDTVNGWKPPRAITQLDATAGNATQQPMAGFTLRDRPYVAWTNKALQYYRFDAN